MIFWLAGFYNQNVWIIIKDEVMLFLKCQLIFLNLDMKWAYVKVRM